jgi:uncharacterized protein (UPF0335 family)
MSDEFDNELDQIMADATAKAEPIPSGTPAAAALIQFIERIERLEEEKTGLMEDIREVYGEAKGAGFDPKIMRAIVRLRKMETADRQEQEALIETYKAAVGMG